MKKILSAVVCLLLILCSVIGCTRNAVTNGVAYNLYFSNLDKNDLVVEQRFIDEIGIDNIAEAVIEELLNGPEDKSHCAVIPQKAKLISLEIAQGIASVNFSKGYFAEGDDADTVELLARYSVINTLCDIDGIDKVKIFIDGVELTNASGVPVGALGKEDILLTTSPNAKEETIVLYFPDEKAVNLVAQSRKVPLIDNSIEKTIIHELIKGPEGKGSVTTIPAETKVISVETKDGMCFVNLSSDFVNKHVDGSSAESFTIYSIVNSLTELDNVSSVQFLIEGQKMDTLKHMVIDEPYTRDESYILK